ncbi:hypothetical protein J1605_009181 [Eschrichtius robustus]|uniref:Uncharacterized protein n=1 Tax=Eschrichtius robustus TaxID=9764 RepID=A0AB34GSP4_ESCRO|nr:hypothetical protein J1605_009181 [Eschrichtius robustus]
MRHSRHSVPPPASSGSPTPQERRFGPDSLTTVSPATGTVPGTWQVRGGTPTSWPPPGARPLGGSPSQPARRGSVRFRAEGGVGRPSQPTPLLTSSSAALESRPRAPPCYVTAAGDRSSRRREASLRGRAPYGDVTAARPAGAAMLRVLAAGA